MAVVLTVRELDRALDAAERLVEIAPNVDPSSGFRPIDAARDAQTVLEALRTERQHRRELINENVLEILRFADRDPVLWEHLRATHPELIARLRAAIGGDS